MTDRALLDEYLATTWAVWSGSGAPLEVRPGARAPSALSPSAIVTAYNPASELRDEGENARADEALRARLDALDVRVSRTVAKGSDPRWTEPGWCALALPRDAAVALAADFGQNAIVWIDAAGEVTIVVTREGFCGARVGEIVR